MRFSIYVPGLPFDGNTIKEGKSLGGSETMGYHVAFNLAQRGHDVKCFCNTSEIKSIDGVDYLPIGKIDQETPYGDQFQRYALNIPCDVLLAQRAAGIFGGNYNSKLNYFWTHDLALKRFHPQINNMMCNTNKILGVSQFHVDQIKKIYGVNPDYIDFIPNGIDLNMCQPGELEIKKNSKILFYSSRPERGLVHLVGEGGVMEKLLQIDPEITLVVTGYDNVTPQSAPLYQQLYQRCQMLPNVRNYGYLSKQELAELMKKAWLHTYPTEFEEVSCITAMEAQSAGTPFLTTQTAALPETLKDSGVFWSPIEKFTDSIIYLAKNPSKYEELYNKAIAKRESYSLNHTVDKLESLIKQDFERLTDNKKRLFNHLVYNSDISAAGYVNSKYDLKQDNFLATHYDTFGTKCDDTEKFYNKIADYQLSIGDNHGLGNYEQTLNMPRVKPFVQHLAQLQPGSKVLDYGCCVGHVTTALANLFPDLFFEGCNIDQSQIDTGNKFIEKNKIENVKLFHCIDPSELEKNKYDAVICGEVLEHIWDYKTFLTNLEQSVNAAGRLYISTPYGPWETSFDKQPYKHQHLHQFEANDIDEILAHRPDREILYINHPDNVADKFGFYFWSWTRVGNGEFQTINYQRKITQQNPIQEVSACFITKADVGTIQKTIQSVKPFVSEIIIGIDKKTLKGKLEDCLTYRIASEFDNVHVFVNESPLDIGFDEARNATIAKATKDWILWLDDDEIWVWADKVRLYLRDNHFSAYAVNQHHFSAEPVGLTKTDLPCRLFRNHKGIRFYGVVHEHPEIGLNKGTEQTFIIPPTSSAIIHVGYESEAVRRSRFQRNWPLMQRDVEKYPDRFLGRALFLRDLDHLNRFEFEQTKQISPQMLERCNEILKRWRKLIEMKQTRFVLDSLVYITNTVNFSTMGQGGYSFKFGIKVDKFNMMPNQDVNMVEGKVESKEDLQSLMSLLTEENMAVFENDSQYL